MGKQLTCPCGVQVVGRDDEFVAAVNAHLAAAHEGRTYPEEAILMMSSPFPDADIPD